jgi:hypothetical protein
MNIQSFFRTVLVAGAMFVGLAQSANAEIVTWTGDTTGAPTFDRPYADFSDLSPNGSGVAYRTHTFTVDTAGDYSFVLTGLQFDTFLFLYENAFDPNAQLDNGLAGNDDAVSINTSGFEGPLSVGTSYVLVVTGFDDESYGAYSITIAGPGVITAVPEPSTWLMLALGLAAVGYAQRRKSMG